MTTMDERLAVDLMEASRQSAVPGYSQREFEQANKMGLGEQTSDWFKTTALYKGYRAIQQEGPALQADLERRGLSDSAAWIGSWTSAFGITERDPSYDPSKHAAELTKDVPVRYWDEILGYDSLDAAYRARARIITDEQRLTRLGVQKGAGSVLAMVAGGMIDVDLPLVLASGGGVAAVKVGRAAYRAGRFVGMGERLATRGASVVQQSWNGLQAGAAVGAAQMTYDDTADFGTLVLSAATGATTGGALGVFLQGDTRKAVMSMREDFKANQTFRPAQEVDTEVDVRANEGSDIFTELNSTPDPAAGTSGSTPGPSPVQGVNADYISPSGYFPAVSRAKANPTFDEWSGGKVVTGMDNEPAIFYHGTSKDVEFNNLKMSKHGIWITDDPDVASQYAVENDSMGFKQDGWKTVRTNTKSRVMPVFVKADNPYTGPMPDHVLGENYKKSQQQWFDALRAQGYDAWIPEDQPGIAVALKDATQVRSIYEKDFAKDTRPKAPAKSAAAKKGADTKKAQADAEWEAHIEDALNNWEADVLGAIPGPSQANNVNAARVQYQPSMKNPFMQMAPYSMSIIRNASDWLDRTGARQALMDLENTTWGRVMTGYFAKQGGVFGKISGAVTRMMNSAGNDVMGLYRSGSNVANWFAVNIFENPSSFGRGIVGSSASTLDSVYERRIASTLSQWNTVLNKWARATNNTITLRGRQTGVGVKDSAARSLYREVMLNVNDILMGRQMRSSDQHVVALVQMIQNHGKVSLDTLQGHDPTKTAVKGTEGLQYNDGYVPQRANGAAMAKLINDGVTTRADIEEAMSAAYQATGMPKNVADAVAKANVGRSLRRDADVDTSLIDLLTEDGRSFLQERLLLQGISQQEVDTIMARLTGMAEERGKAGFTKHRNDLDFDWQVKTSDGSDLRIVDLMDYDLPNMLQRYRKGVSGSSALARKGIRSRKDRDIMVQAIRDEQMALGEIPIESDKLKAMLSGFDSGPIYGYGMGKLNKGVHPFTSLVKDIANLSLLNNLGFAQLAETGSVIASAGLANFWNHASARGITSKLANVNKELKKDLAVFMGEIGMDQHIFRPHVHLDEVADMDMPAWFNTVRKGAQNLSAVQAYTSLFNTVRSAQQQLAATVMSNKVLGMIKAGEPKGGRITTDYGVSDELYDIIKGYIDGGVIEFKNVDGIDYVNRLNPDQWTATEIDDFASVMVRITDTRVQKALTGETDTWMHTEIGSILTHLKMFPLVAIPKQFMRNARYMDMETAGAVGFGLAASYLAIQARDILSGNDRSVEERAAAAVSYSNMLGWMPMIYDPAMTMLGLDEYRMNRYGAHYTMTVPTVEVANRMMRVPGAISDYITGEANGYDKQALLAIPFMRTLGIGEWLLGTPDGKERPKKPKEETANTNSIPNQLKIN